MFSHIMLGSDDLAASKKFYDAALGTLGIDPGIPLSDDRIYYAGSGASLMITKPINGGPASCANGGTVGFTAKSPTEADAWHAAGLANGVPLAKILRASGMVVWERYISLIYVILPVTGCAPSIRSLLSRLRASTAKGLWRQKLMETRYACG